jgi:hypothetical protein
MKMRILALVGLALALALPLSACATNPYGGGGITAPTPRQIVYGLNAAYVPSAKLAATYEHLPPCGDGTPICADPAIVATIKADDTKAYTAIQKATETVQNSPAGSPDILVDIAAAEAALGALQGDTAIVKVK